MDAKKTPEPTNPALPDGLPEGLVRQLPKPDTNGLRFTLNRATITLPTGIEAQLLVLPGEQQPSISGDGLYATALIYLPRNDKWYFGGRVQLFEEGTNANWGYGVEAGPPEKKYSKRQHIGFTWLDALQIAEAYALQELAKLWNALETREAVLHSEGEEYYIAHNSIAKRE